MDQCYYAGRIKKSSYDENHIYCGYLIGETDYDHHEVNYVWKPDIPRIGTWSNVMFVRYPDADGIKMIGTSSADDRVPGDITAVSYTHLHRHGRGFLPGSESHEVKSAGSHPQRVRVIRTWHEFTMCQLETACVQQKILAFSARIRYPVYRACDWRKKWGTTGEHVY